jgi:hypothetical protein
VARTGPFPSAFSAAVLCASWRNDTKMVAKCQVSAKSNSTA